MSVKDPEEKYEDLVEDHKAATADSRLRDAEQDYPDVVENYGKVYNRFKRTNLQMFGENGKTGNPGGRPKTKLISQAYRKVLQQIDPDDPEGKTFAEIIAYGMVRQAATDARAAKEVRETTEGKLPNKIQVQGEIEVNHILVDASDEEIDEIIQNYLERAYSGRDPETCSVGDGREESPDEAAE